MNTTTINTKSVKIKKDYPSKYLLFSIDESKKDRKKNDYHSFKNNEEAIKLLDK